jgi:hypothetical protein
MPSSTAWDYRLTSSPSGDPAAARDQLTALLPSLERVFGPDYPTTLTARSALAAWTGQAGDAAAARDQLTAHASDPPHPRR